MANNPVGDVPIKSYMSALLCKNIETPQKQIREENTISGEANKQFKTTPRRSVARQ